MSAHVNALGLLAPLILWMAACTWIHPSEPLREVPADIVLPQFSEVPVEFAHEWDRMRGHHLTGGSAIDVDGDGRFELFVGGSTGQPDALLSLRDGRLVDRIEGTGLSSRVATYGSTAIDFDADGDVDLFVARDDGVTWYENTAGQMGAGADHAPSFIAHPIAVDAQPNAIPLMVSISDIDRDGDGDLYLSMFVDFPHFISATFNVPSHAKANVLLRNDGGLHFTDITTTISASKQNTFTSAFVDLDGDGLDDLVVAQNTGQAEILHNVGGGEFERVPLDSGYGFWMGVAVGDYDADGDPDLLFTNVGDSFPGFLAEGDLHEDQRFALGWLLLRNDGGMDFHDATEEAGLEGLGFAWGALFEDVNLDGELDLVVAQNYVKWPVHRLFKFPGKILLGAGTPHGFHSAPVAENRAFSNTPLFADFDGDGRLDLFWLNNDGPSRAYLNQTAGHSVILAFPDSVASLGVRARVEGAVARYTRALVSGAGLGSDPAPWLVFGLGSADSAERVVVDWPDGRQTVIDHPAVDRPIAVE
jgi:hypothetical protein